MKSAKLLTSREEQQARMLRGLALWKGGMSYAEVAKEVGVTAPTVQIWVDNDPEVREARLAEAKRLAAIDVDNADAREQYLDIAGRTAEFARLLQEFQLKHNCVPKVPPVREREFQLKHNCVSPITEREA